ncbi:hypothetical protein D3C85_996260 [compost metagenome]
MKSAPRSAMSMAITRSEMRLALSGKELKVRVSMSTASPSWQAVMRGEPAPSQVA